MRNPIVQVKFLLGHTQMNTISASVMGFLTLRICSKFKITFYFNNIISWKIKHFASDVARLLEEKAQVSRLSL